MKIASIDIGTNTILLLIASVTENGIEIIEDYHKIARLGEGVDATGQINENALQRAKRLLEFYKERIEYNEVKYIKAVATSAMRDASNSREISSKLETIIETKIDIISGEDEAKLSFLGSSENKKAVVLDIGGGSTEIIAGKAQILQVFKSLNIGAVRVTERFNLTNKNIEDIEKAEQFVREQISKIKLDDRFFPIAVAGTPNTMAMMNLGMKEYDRRKLHNYHFSLNEITEVKKLIIDHTPKVLVEKYNVHPNRADIILGGAIILEAFVKVFEYNSICVSSNGLRFGVVQDFFNKYNSN